MPTREKATPKEVYINNALPTLHVDSIDARYREDGLIYLSFASNTPHLLVEQVRLMIDDASLHTIIDALCRTTNYFPERPSKKERDPSK